MLERNATQRNATQRNATQRNALVCPNLPIKKAMQEHVYFGVSSCVAFSYLS